MVEVMFFTSSVRLLYLCVSINITKVLLTNIYEFFDLLVRATNTGRIDFGSDPRHSGDFDWIFFCFTSNIRVRCGGDSDLVADTEII